MATPFSPPRKARSRIFVVTLLALVALGVAGVLTWHLRRIALKREAQRHNNLGVALFERGREDLRHSAEEAKEEFEAALRLVPDYRPARFNLALFIRLTLGEELDRAETLLQELVEDDPEDLRAHFTLGLVQEHVGKNQEAARHFEVVTRRDPGDGFAWMHLGATSSQASVATNSFEKAIQLLPLHPVPRYRLWHLLRKAGEQEKAQAQREKFNEIKEGSKDGPPPFQLDRLQDRFLGLGKYAEPIADSEIIGETPDPAPIYREMAREKGLTFEHAGNPEDPQIRRVLSGEPIAREWFERPENRKALIEALGTGASFCDFQGDGRLDLFLVNVNGKHGLFEQTAEGSFVDVTEKAGLSSAPLLGTGCVWGDYDDDGLQDLFISAWGNASLHRNEGGKFADVTEVSKIGGAIAKSTWCMGAAFADIDHDADLDLVVSCLVDLTKPSGKPLLEFPGDFEAQPILVFRNNRDGTFTEIGKEAIRSGGHYPARGVRASDLDADGAVDLVAFDLAGDSRTLLSKRDGTFEEAPMALPRHWKVPPPGESHAFGDLDRDGAVDLLVNRAGARAELRVNLKKPWIWLTVGLKGYTGEMHGLELKSNLYGIGALVEARAVGRWWQKELAAGNGSQGCDAPEVTFDLRGVRELDFVRALFPSGARKTLRGVGPNQKVTIEEPELLGRSSCPTLFSWDGEKFEFIADTLSAGILGGLVSPGEYFSPDPDEWLRIPPGMLEARPDEGCFALRFVNSLEEVTYLDQVRLLAVDHDASLSVFPSERMVGDPGNRRPVRFCALKEFRPPGRVTRSDGKDVTEELSRIDRVYASAPRPLPFTGFAEDWSLTLDLVKGPGVDRPRDMLCLHGWSQWNSSASVIAAHQAGRKLWGPVLEVLGPEGSWRLATEDLGVPAGLPRTMLFDLRGVLKEGESAIRIRTNHTIHYDQILVADVEEEWEPFAGKPLMCREQEVPLRGAELRRLGYPRRTLPDGRLPEVFDYQEIEPHSEWSVHRGFLTRLGDVTPLLAAADDMFAVMGHGEEVALTFEGRSLAKLPDGWKRTFVFYSVGYEKGFEMWSAHSRTIEPLPFKAMKGYPATGGSYPLDEEHIRYLMEWNTRSSLFR